MVRRSYIGFFTILMICLATGAVALADKLTLKDGTVLEGRVIKQADGYWIKTTDGASKIIPATDVASYSKTTPPAVKPATPSPDADSGKPNPAKPTTAKPGPTAKPATPAPPTPAAPPPPPQVVITVPATASHSAPFATGVKLSEGQQFILTPNPADKWGKGDGPSNGKTCDYKGFADRPGWMALACKVGKTGVDFTPGTAAAAGEAGELFLFCSDDKDPTKNVGTIRVTVVGPLAPSVAWAKTKAESFEKASDAVKLWSDFLAAHPAAEDEKAGKDELARWTEMASGGAEKINGKWVSGDEHKKLMETVNGLVKEAMEHFQKNETLQAVKKMEQAQAMYPNSFFVNFLLGYLAFKEGDLDKAMPLFERAKQLRPKSSEALANIGLIHFKKKEYEKGLDEVEQAAEISDSMELAIDLSVMVHTAPDNVKKSPKMKEVESSAKLLSSKYSLPPDMWRFAGIVPVPMHEGGGGDGEPPPGAKASGTGFVINSDGLILTNRHVAKGGKSYEVTLQGGTKLVGEVVIIDDEQDLALIRVKSDKPLPTVKFADHDAPGDGAECTVIGFPLGDRYTSSPKVTHGIVTGHTNTEGADVIIDAKVNPGNSGGPILDKSGDVMAIVCMKSIATEMEDSYGLGISAGKIRKFLDKNKIKTTKASTKGPSLTAEEIAEKIEPMTVFIVTTY